jgi:SAM-dependent methyltransferase
LARILRASGWESAIIKNGFLTDREPAHVGHEGRSALRMHMSLASTDPVPVVLYQAGERPEEARGTTIERAQMRGIEHIPWLYDGLTAVLDILYLGPWRRALVAPAGGRVLEVGCGTGRNLPLYLPGTWTVGLDPDLGALLRARRRSPGALLVAGRAEALPFGPGTFDTVVSSLVFCSVDHPRRGLEEVRRVLRPEGELRMLEHVRDRRPAWSWLQDKLQPLWTWVTGGCRPNRDTEATVEHAGFRIDARGRRASRALRLFRARPGTARLSGDH